ncbi:MAG: hypothetical protein WAZ60_24025 [Desulfosalsimonadaceae bacterium]
MADTVTLLKGLQFTKTATSDVWTIDGEGSAYEAVKTFEYRIPCGIDGIKTAQVIFNNNYDLAASRVHVRVKLCAVSRYSPMPPVIAESQIMEWTAIAAQGITVTPEIDVSAYSSAILFIDMAITSTTAHDGTEIIPQVKKEAGLDEWTSLQSFVGPSGTATKSDCSGETAAGQTVVGVTNPTTGNLNHLGKFIFFEDTDTIAQCEIAYLTATSGD